MTVACLILMWEQLRISYYPGLPSFDPQNSAYWGFRLSAFAMSLILSLRLGRAYDRWCEGGGGGGGGGAAKGCRGSGRAP